jgi:glycolate oxidase FAD binding subunit
MSRFAPADLDELRDAIGEALAAEEPLEVVAGGSKRGLGRPLQLPRMLDLSHLAGIRDYQPSELVLTAGAATPIEEVESALAGAAQMLAFEPPDLGALFGLPASVSGQRTLSGPRRIKSGAARDHFLGFRGVSGRGEVLRQAARSSKTSPAMIFAS